MKAFNIKGKILDLSTAKVMGILNITDDSFFDGGAYLNKNKMLEKCGKMLLEGASIIDIGAQSSRPRAKPIDFEVENPFHGQMEEGRIMWLASKECTIEHV